MKTCILHLCLNNSSGDITAELELPGDIAIASDIGYSVSDALGKLAVELRQMRKRYTIPDGGPLDKWLYAWEDEPVKE